MTGAMGYCYYMAWVLSTEEIEFLVLLGSIFHSDLLNIMDIGSGRPA
jgi:hypothetical protein